MKRYSEVVGLPVFCADTGNKLADVLDVVFLREDRRIPALIVGNRFISNGNTAIMLKDVLSIGNDAVMVRDKSALTKIDKHILDNKVQLNGMNVYTEEGKSIGIVKDVLFETETGNIEGVEISDSLLNDIVVGRNIVPLLGNVTLSEENMFVAKEAYDEMLHGGGGLKARLGFGNGQYSEFNNS